MSIKQSNEMIQMGPEKTTRACEFMIRNNFNFLIVGAPGTAKTAIIEQSVRKVGHDLIIFHPVISDPTDFKGMPAIMKCNEMEFLARFVPFDNLKRLLDADRPTVAFADDLGQAPPMVQAAWMQLVLARRLDDKVVSKNITFISASNRKEDKAGVTGILEPLKSRFVSIIELVPDREEWLKWARNEGAVHPYVRAFVKVRGDKFMFDFAPTNDMTNSVCPRTVKHVSDIMKGRPDDDLRATLIAGSIGAAWAVEFEGFIKVVKNLPKMSAIIAKPKECPVPPNEEASAQYAIVEAMIDFADKKYIEPFLTYISRFKPEFQQWFISQLKEIKPQCLNHAAYTKWAAETGIK